MVLEWLKAITYLLLAIGSVLIGGSLLHLFGVPSIYYLVFAIGVLVGGWGASAFFYRFAPQLLPPVIDADAWEEDDEIDQSRARVVICQLERYPAFPEVERCCYVVWRNAGKVEFLKAIDVEAKTTEFTQDEEAALQFSSFTDAQSAANFAWFINGCSYEFRFEMWVLSDEQAISIN